MPITKRTWTCQADAADESLPGRLGNPHLSRPKSAGPHGARRTGHDGLLINSILGSGTVIIGATVRRSILSSQIRVEEGAVVEDSLLFDGVHVGRDARLRGCIVDENVKIPPGETIGLEPAKDAQRFTISEKGSGGAQGISVSQRGVELFRPMRRRGSCFPRCWHVGLTISYRAGSPHTLTSNRNCRSPPVGRRGERHAGDDIRMPYEALQHLAGGDVPVFHRAIVAAGEEASAVRRNTPARRCGPIVSRSGAAILAGRDVPYVNHRIPRREDIAAIGRKGEIGHRLLMSVERLDELPRVSDRQRAPSCRHRRFDVSPVRREGDGVDKIGVSGVAAEFFTAVDVP